MLYRIHPMENGFELSAFDLGYYDGKNYISFNPGKVKKTDRSQYKKGYDLAFKSI